MTQPLPHEPAPQIRFEGVSKRFPGAKALERVSFDIAAGSVHALCGENGAGKSTLGKILAGIHAHDEGNLYIEGRPRRFASPREALADGIAMVHQELAFCENLGVAENLCLEALPARGWLVDYERMHALAREKLSVIGADLDVTQPLGALRVAQQQMVQIAAAVSGGARVVVFDEPTSSLTRHETERLFDLVRELKARGVTCIYVSHRMNEIFKLCDTVTVLRDGRHVATRPIEEMDEALIVKMMIGRALEAYFPKHLGATPGDELLRVESLTSPGKFEDVSFTLRAGEVLGLAGLVGAGRTEIAQALFGLDPQVTGRVWVKGEAVRIRHPREAMRLGMGLAPEDRKRHGLVLELASRANISLPILPRLATAGFVRRAEEESMTRDYFERLRVRAPDSAFPAAGLSGGNQQKLVLAKWLAARCAILMLDEPTRGVDVGAKAEIHALIDALAREEKAILLISSELPEVINLSTRILVLREGRVVAEVARGEATQEVLMGHMAGVAKSA